MREIVLDTETTGLDPSQGHRIVEIGCLELRNRTPTGERFHAYCNPQRDVPEESRRITNLSTEFLADKPLFAQVVDGFLGFIGDSPLVIHNAEFDLKFLNSELKRVNKPLLTSDRAIDTLMMARRRFPGASASLDALCRRFDIALDERKSKGHGALLDVELLAQVYLELSGGRQPGLELSASSAATNNRAAVGPQRAVARPTPLPSRLSEDERARHERMVASLGPSALWKQ
ncbi:MAG: DNA polymerase III subunit epsilon [Alphaproteobacteria bacterium]|nr:DNA polymerase III subunit epsilon [Alphaproteobacteria bacterium]